MTTIVVEQPKREQRRSVRWIVAGLACFILLIGMLMAWGGYLLVAQDGVPVRADAAVVLEGSLVGERVRLAGAMDLLRQGKVDRVLVTLPEISYWGEPVPPLARRFLVNTYGTELAARVDLCNASPDVDSTLQEAYAIGTCVREHRWKSIVVVTSNYHTRRAGIIWRRVMRKENPSLQISIRGVEDPDFEPRRWWTKRIWAKTWLLESTKLLWAGIVRR